MRCGAVGWGGGGGGGEGWVGGEEEGVGGWVSG